jgi:hypothetical protein
LLATTLATGFGTLSFLAVLWLGSAIHEAWQDRRHPFREDLVVTADGIPLIMSTPLDNLSAATFRDRNGVAHDVDGAKDLLSAVYLSGESENEGDAFLAVASGWGPRLKYFVDERAPTLNWFFVHDGKPQGSGYFAGYERVSNRLVGYIGLAGLRTDPLPASERIAVRGAQLSNGSSWSSEPSWVNSRRAPAVTIRPGRWDLPPRLVHVPSGNQLRKVDLAARTVATVFEASEPIEAVGVPIITAYSNAQLTKALPILVRTSRTIYGLDHDYRTSFTFPFPTGADRRSLVRWYDLGNGRAVVDFLGSDLPASPETDGLTQRLVCRVGADGTIEESFALRLQMGSPAMDRQAGDFLLALALPAPAILIAIEPFLLMVRERARSYPAAVGAMLTGSWPSLAGALALSAVLAMIASRRSRVFGPARSDRAVWTCFVLLLGLPAFLGFLLARRWPIRTPCPHCGARSPRDRGGCAACGTRFPDPPYRGIEIFA